MKNYVSFFQKHRKQFLGLMMLVNVLAIAGLFQLKINTDFGMLGNQDSKYQDLLEEQNVLFGNSEQMIVLVPLSNWSIDIVREYVTLKEQLTLIDGVDSVQGIEPEIVQMVNMQPVLIPLEETTIDLYDAYYESFGAMSPIHIKDDLHYLSYTLILNDEFHTSSLHQIEDLVQTYTQEFHLAGDLYNQLKVFDYIILILLMLIPLTMVTILFVFYRQMKSFKATILSVVPAGLGALWTMGLLGWIGNEVSLITAIVPIFVIVIGSADGLHFMSHMQEEFAKQMKSEDGIAHTLHMVGVPMIITTITSVAGFLALLTMQIKEMQDLAMGAAIGITFAGIATWWVLPLILLEIKSLGSHKETKERSTITERLKKLQGAPSIVLAVLVILSGIFFYPDIKSEFNMLMFYKNYTEVAVNVEMIQEIVGGAIPQSITLDLEKSFGSIDSYNQLEELETALLEMDEVTRVLSPRTLIQILSSQFQIPLNESSVGMITSRMLTMPNLPLSNLYNKETNQVRIMVFLRDLDNETLNRVEEVAADYGVEITGVQYVLKELNETVMQTQLTSIVIALGIVYVLMLITLRSFKLSLLSIVPIMISTFGLYGFLGISGISLNLMTLIIFSITIGVGIDYAVHFVSVYKVYRQSGLDVKESVDQSYYYTSKPVFANAIGVATGLTILLLSPLVIHFNVSVLMWVSMVLSVLFTLTLLPTFLKRLKG